MSDTTASERLTLALIALADSEQRTPCQDGKRSARWTSDDVDDLEWAAFHCVSLACPLLDICAAAAAELKPTAGAWAGTTYPIPKKKRAAA